MTNEEIDAVVAHWPDLNKLDLDAFAAFLHRQYGGEACKAFMELRAEQLAREFLEDAADELADKGLDHVATILREIAITRPWGLDQNPHQKGSANWQSHRQSWFNRRRMHRRTQIPRNAAEPYIKPKKQNKRAN